MYSFKIQFILVILVKFNENETFALLKYDFNNIYFISIILFLRL